jgi:magnesium-transporting ATPase (P-type)
LGIITRKEDLILSGTKMAALSKRVFRIVEHARVYARVNLNKIKNYKSTASKRPVVAMTGDVCK